MAAKKNLSEDDTSAKFITPALYQAGWDEAVIRRQVALCDQLEAQLRINPDRQPPFAGGGAGCGVGPGLTG